LTLGLILGTYFLATISSEKEKVIVVIDNTGEYFPVLKSNSQCRFIEAEQGIENSGENSDKSVYATLIITADLMKNPDAIVLYSEKLVASGVENTIVSQLNNYLSDKKLESYNIPNIKDIIKESRININLKSVKWDETTDKETHTSAETASMVGIVFTFLIYMFIFAYGAMVMQGVMEEKTNRIIEIIVSSVKPFDLMMGKLIGIGLVGLTQFGIWALLFLGIAGGSLFIGNPELAMQIGNITNGINLVEICFFFVLFFIGGYLIYATLFAAVGAVVNSPEDSQQYIMPITVLILFAFYAGSYSSQNPDGPLAFWTSLIPFTSPIVMMVRLPFGVPWWQLLVSIVLMFSTAIFITSFVAKIYRIGILMYGKKPTYSEIMKWLKY
jgi:ABC-2 type transport system permease protein